MLPDIPVSAPKQMYLLTGRFLELVRQRVYRQTPLEGTGIDFEYTASGIIPHARGAELAGSTSLNYAFKATWTDTNEVTIASGCVYTPTYSGWTQDSPTVSNWFTETVVAEAPLTVASGDSIWLEVVTPVTNSTILGPLPTDGATAHTVTTGGGGGGGQGGGGGSGGNLAVSGTDGAAGDDAVDNAAGAGGDGGANGGDSPGEGDGVIGWGGAGGDGGLGGAGEEVSFSHYTQFRIRTRRYGTLSAALTVSASKPSGTHTTHYVRIASISGATITQHHAGNYHFTPPVFAFIP